MFTQAITQASSPAPSLGVITTSTYPPVNRVREWGDSIRPDLPTLAETLKACDYRTLFVGGNGRFRKGLHGFDRGFTSFYEAWESASVLTQKALALVGKDVSKPFLWVHYMDVHERSPSPRLEGLFMNDGLFDGQKKLPLVKDFLGRYGYNGIPKSLAEKRGGTKIRITMSLCTIMPFVLSMNKSTS